jgi:glycosyltransferase involved in cell wall biosynthesis
MNPLVSILVPCYNAAPWLAETLESAIAQTWKNTEIIVVDDGSSDQSLAIAQSYASKGIQVLGQSNQGASAARNHALRIAQGDFIQFLDADDLLAPDKIEQQLQSLNLAGPNPVMSGAWARFHQTPTEARFIPQLLWRDLSAIQWLTLAWQHHLMMHPAAWLVPRSLTEAVGGWNETLSLDDDGEYFCRIILASQQVLFCPTARSYYRSRNAGSLSDQKSYAAWKSALAALQLEEQHLLCVRDSPQTRAACAARYQRFLYAAYPTHPELIKTAEARIRELGGTQIRPEGGAGFRLITSLFGWKAAKVMQQLKLSLSSRPLSWK